MKVSELCQSLNLEVLNEGDFDIQITGCYSGDLLSWVISKVRPDNVWLSVMGNVNAIAVAVLSDCACLILTENSEIDALAMQKAKMSGVNVLRSSENAYQLSVKIFGLI